jgi:hypothetical protein
MATSPSPGVSARSALYPTPPVEAVYWKMLVAGIVVGCIIVALLASAIIFYFVRLHRGYTSSSEENVLPRSRYTLGLGTPLP